MRIKCLDDVNKLGANAKRQVQAAIDSQGGINNIRRITGLHELGCKVVAPNIKENIKPVEKGNKTPLKKKTLSRVMNTSEGKLYCPWPSPDPFVKVHQLLEEKFGRYEDGGSFVTEMIVAGGDKDWRFDFALLPKTTPLSFTADVPGASQKKGYIGNCALLIEADGFAFHKTLDAFKNDRAKQTHALQQGFVVQRVTNEDVRTRIDAVMDNVYEILSHQRIYEKTFVVESKGKTQSVFRWSE